MRPTSHPTDDRRPGLIAALFALVKEPKILAGIAALLVLVFVGYQWVQASNRRADEKQLAKVRDMMDEMRPKQASLSDMVKGFMTRDPAKRKEMREKGQQIRDEAKKLSPESRRQLDEERMKMMASMTREFKKLPKAQQNAILDLFIDQMEADRKEREARAKSAKSSDSESDQGNGPGGQRRGPRTDEEKEKARQAFFDRTTPEARAAMAEGMFMMNQRRVDRGLPPLSFANPQGRPGAPR